MTGDSNTGIGYQALSSNVIGGSNSALGYGALSSNNNGFGNTAVGFGALFSNINGNDNTAVGWGALILNTNGGANTAIGEMAGKFIANGNANATGTQSLFLGYNTRANADGENNQVVIGANAIGAGSNSVVLGSDSITKTLLKGNIGIGTTSPFAKLSVNGDGFFGGDLRATNITATGTLAAGTSTLTNLIVSNTSTSTFAGGISALNIALTGTATSTAANGFNITSGCYAVNGTCLGGSSGSGTVNSGTAGQLAYYSANGTAVSGTSSLFLASSGKVGIGTTSPFALLSVIPGSLSVSNILNVETYDNNEILNIDSSGRLRYGEKLNYSVVGPYVSFKTGASNGFVSGDFMLIDPRSVSGGAVLNVRQNGQSYLYVDNTGNIGVGTTTPYSKLSVWGNSTGTGQLFSLINSASTTLFQVLDNGTAYFNGTGNVGIGTTSPFAKLSVVGEVVASNFTATSTTATSTFAGGLNVGNGALVYDASSGITTINGLSTGPMNLDADGGQVSWIDMTVTSASAAGTVEQYTAQLNSNPMLSIYGLADGAGGVTNLAVGIGTTSPNAKLTVWGNGTTTGQTFAVINSASTTNFVVLDNGNVGIGTTSPSKALSVNGSGYFAGSITASSFVATSTTATSTFAYNVAVSGKLNLADSNHAIVIGDVSGKTSASYALDIQSSGANASQWFNTGDYATVLGYGNKNSSASSTVIGVKNSIDTTGSFGSAVLGFENELNGGSFSTLVGRGNYSEDSEASLLLGTSNNASEAAQSSIIGYENFAYSATSTVIGNGSTLDSGSGGSLLLGNGNYTVDSEYSNTIGSSNDVEEAPYSSIFGYLNLVYSPGSLVLGNNNSVSSFAASTSIYGFGNTVSATSSITIGSNITNAIANSLMIGPSDTSKLTILSSGNVGIGTTSPYAKLSVVGEVVASNFTATSTTATSTFAGGLNVGNGALVYDYSSGITSIGAFETGAINFDTDAGVVNWTDLTVSSAPSGTVQSYTANLNGTPMLTVYGVSAGSGAVGSLGVGIGTITPSAKLTVWGNGTTTGQTFAVVNSASTTNFAVLDNGNVGIGTTSPYAALSIVGATGVVADHYAATSTTASSTFTAINIFGAGTSTIANNLYVQGTLRSTISYVGDLVFSNGFRFIESTTSPERLNLTNGTGANIFTIDESGNMGLGTTTPAYKLQVMGDVAANAFVNTSTRDSKQDITYLTGSDKISILDKIKDIKIAQYHYKTEDSSNPLRLGLIAEEAPSEVLSVSGKGVDIYKLSTFILAGVQELQLKVESIDSRVAALENAMGVASTTSLVLTTASGTASTTSELNAGSITSFFGSLAIKFSDTVAEFKDIIANTIAAKHVKVEEGITVKDKATGAYYCIVVENGVMKNVPGECGAGDTVSPTPSITPTPSVTVSPSSLVLPGSNPTPTPVPTLTPATTASSTPSATTTSAISNVTVSPSPTPALNATPSPSPVVSVTPSVTPSASPVITPVVTTTPAPEVTTVVTPVPSTSSESTAPTTPPKTTPADAPASVATNPSSETVTP